MTLTTKESTVRRDPEHVLPPTGPADGRPRPWRTKWIVLAFTALAALGTVIAVQLTGDDAKTVPTERVTTSIPAIAPSPFEIPSGSPFDAPPETGSARTLRRA